MFSSADAPTPEDLRFARVGMLTIVRLADLHFRGAAPEWRLIGAGELTGASIPGELSSAFHAAVGQICSADAADRPLEL